MFVPCKECIFWKKAKADDTKAPCYLMPPKPFPLQGQGVAGPQIMVISVRPETTENEGCAEGEFPEQAAISPLENGVDKLPIQDILKL